jgi:hypothetical protein
MRWNYGSRPLEPQWTRPDCTKRSGSERQPERGSTGDVANRGQCFFRRLVRVRWCAIPCRSSNGRPHFGSFPSGCGRRPRGCGAAGNDRLPKLAEVRRHRIVPSEDDRSRTAVRREDSAYTLPRNTANSRVKDLVDLAQTLCHSSLQSRKMFACGITLPNSKLMV